MALVGHRTVRPARRFVNQAHARGVCPRWMPQDRRDTGEGVLAAFLAVAALVGAFLAGQGAIRPW